MRFQTLKSTGQPLEELTLPGLTVYEASYFKEGKSERKLEKERKIGRKYFLYSFCVFLKIKYFYIVILFLE